MKGFIKDYKANEPLESNIIRFFVLIPSAAPIAKTLTPLTSQSLHTIFNDFAKVLSYLMKLKEIEQTKYYIKSYKQRKKSVVMVIIPQSMF